MSCNKLGYKAFDEKCIGCTDFEECFKKKLPALNKYVAEQARLAREKFKSDKRINDEIIGRYDILKVWVFNKSTFVFKCPYCGINIVNDFFELYLRKNKKYAICPNCFTISERVRIGIFKQK